MRGGKSPETFGSRSLRNPGQGKAAGGIIGHAVAVLAEPAVRGKLEQVGVVVIGSTPDELAAFLGAEMDKWGHVIKAANISAQ